MGRDFFHAFRREKRNHYIDSCLMIVILHNIRSLYNVGSIFRTADAAGIEKIYLCGITPSPLDRFGKIKPQISKVALGAEKTTPWEKIKDANRLIKKLKNDGFKIYAIEQDKKSIPYYRVRLVPESLPITALVLGDEVRGLPRSILSKADGILEIPMRGKLIRDPAHPKHMKKGKESLNVGVAFGIVAFSLLRG